MNDMSMSMLYFFGIVLIIYFVGMGIYMLLSKIRSFSGRRKNG